MDDLLGLDLSKQPNPSSQSRPPAAKGNPSYGRSTFDSLSSAQPTTRTPSPSLQRAASPLAPRTAAPSTTAGTNLRPTNGGGDDAFSSLFGGGSDATTGGLSMAERLAKESAGRNGGMGNGSASGVSWTALSPTSTGGSGSRAASPASYVPARAGFLNTLARASPAPRASAPDPWDFDLLAPTTSAKGTSPIPTALDPFSLEFDLPSSSPPPPPPSSTAATAATAATDEFDLLGLLSAPVSSLPSRPSPSPAPSFHTSPRPPPSHTSPRPPPSRASSPPPHVLGQMVEMGFSVSQARIALIATLKEGGEWDVEGALEVLVEEGQREDLRVQVEEEQGLNGRERSRRRSWEEEQVVEPPRVGRRAREAAEREKGGREDAAAKVQEQAAELLAQASKIGFSVFKSANAYWETGRATIQKALDEKMAAEEGEGGAKKGKERERREGKGRTRPKWMTEDVQGEEGEESRAESRSEGKRRERSRSPPRPLFQDSDEEVIDSVLPQRPVPRKEEERKPRPPVPSASTKPPPPAEPAADYRSPWRRPKSSSTPEPASRPPPPSAPAQRPPPSQRPPAAPRPSPAPKPTRPPRVLVPASPAQLASSTTHKAKGNDLFKLGRFGDAEQSYSLAIAALPSSHLALVPLLNNRANARLKVGDEKGAAEDCSSVVAFVLGPTGSVERIDFAALKEESGEFNLKEQLSKALGRRAKAYEAMEQWEKALEDWTAVMQGGEAFARGAGGTKLASEGVARCRKMLGGASSRVAAPAKPTSRTVPVVGAKPVVVASGEAVKALRTANDAADAEDDLRLSLKDAVDAKLFSWKGGKEANLRALIASLDNVLWPELEWKKVGMHELISEGQLKMRYVRAIGKLHPDKLNVGNTTVEQRMIAGAVFSALNDAWNASKS